MIDARARCSGGTRARYRYSADEREGDSSDQRYPAGALYAAETAQARNQVAVALEKSKAH